MYNLYIEKVEKGRGEKVKGRTRERGKEEKKERKRFSDKSNNDVYACTYM